MTKLVTRFAPSPNGPLHLGHAYSAIIAHDVARAAGGKFLLRIEDIDEGRSRPELAKGFRRDLEWLGLEWEEVPAQSTRSASYSAALEQLCGLGLLYPCACTRAQIAAKAEGMSPEGPIYPGICRGKDIPTNQASVAWRLDMAKAVKLTGPLRWVDQLVGTQVAAPQKFGDVVLARKDGGTSYHLAATLDDEVDGVTLVTRGADLFSASHIHRLLQALLGLRVPQWHHHRLLLDESGGKLAKRRNSPSLTDRRLAGEDGRALAAQLRAEQFPAGICLSPPLHSGL